MLTTEREFLTRYVDKLCSHPLANAFRYPVDPEKDGAPDYFQVIKKPMDLGKVKSKLEANEYQSANELISDVNLIWSNAIKYNDKKSLVYQCAKRLQLTCKQWFEVIPKNEMELWELKLKKQQNKLQRIIALHKEVDDEIPRAANLDMCIPEKA